MRSKLFVPGSRPELFAKAMASEADALSFDLEDAVEESRKDEARSALGIFLSGRDRARDRKVVVVRINALGTKHFQADLDAMVGSGVDIINLPMAETGAQVREAVEMLARTEKAHGVAKPLPLLVNIETPKALRLAYELAAAAPRVVGLQLGFADMFEPLGIDRRNPDAVQQVQLQVRMAAGEAGIWAYDSAFADVGNPDAYRHEAEMSRRLGFLGKSCIHPRQIPIANEAFQPTEREIAHAVEVLAASRKAEAAGIGAYLVAGQMIDVPFVRRARDVVAMATKLGLMPQVEAAGK